MKEIILDRSGENEARPEFSIIETDLDFLRCEVKNCDKLWVRGDFLCSWVKSLYRVRHQENTVVKELESPFKKLEKIIGIKLDLIDKDLLDKILKLSEKENFERVTDLLASLTNNDFWNETESVGHAANWLLIEFEDSLRELVQQCQEKWKNQTDDEYLKKIYSSSVENKKTLLKDWLFKQDVIKHLGDFPLRLESKHEEIIIEEIAHQLISTEGKAVLKFPCKTNNSHAYAKAIVNYFSHNTEKLSCNILSHASSLLSTEQISELKKILTLSNILPLPKEADHKEALKWATDSYLPLRDYELNNPNINQQSKADELAISFVNWTLNNYPKLTNYNIEESRINTKTHHIVKDLSKENWVLWVVVDGLNYLDHHKLLNLLGKHASLRVLRDETVLAVLPTITKRAKYGLTVGRFAYQEDEIKEEEMRKTFSSAFPNGAYSGNTGVKCLRDGLNDETPKVCYWNYTQIDKKYHEYTDLNSARIEVDLILEGLAKNINILVNNAFDPKRVAVVICSDHGQMLKDCKKLDLETKGTFTHGRTALGSLEVNQNNLNEDFVISENLETVYLNPKSFRLYEPTTVVYKLGYLAEDKKKTKGGIGFHGGLFPEETVLGLSVLFRDVIYKPITVKIVGNGEDGKPGNIKVQIINPNQAPMDPLRLSIDRLDIVQQAELFTTSIPAQDSKEFVINIERFPSPNVDNQFRISGELEYKFSDGTKQKVEVVGSLTIKTLYTPKGPSLRDRFKK